MSTTEGAHESAGALDGILQLGLGFWRSGTLLAAVRLGVFTALAPGPLDRAELARRTGVHERGARDFFDALVALGLLQRDDDEYRNAPHAAKHLDAGRTETYVGGLLEEAGEQWTPAWAHLAEALSDGKPRWVVQSDADIVYNTIYSSPERFRRFQLAMRGGAMAAMLALPSALPWGRWRTVADVGCCGGEVLAHLLTVHPHLSAVGFDLPVVATAFEETAASRALTGRMSFASGDFLADPLPTADVLVFGHVLHNWDVETKKALLRKAHDALPEHGQVVIYEVLIDDERRHNIDGLMMSLHMLVMSPAGFGYTGADCQGWLAAVGFRSSRVEHLAGHEYVVIGTKGS